MTLTSLGGNYLAYYSCLCLQKNQDYTHSKLSLQWRAQFGLNTNVLNKECRTWGEKSLLSVLSDFYWHSILKMNHN